MSEFDSYPRENQFSTQIIGELLESAVAPFILNVKKAPSFSLASGTFYAVVEPGTSREEGLIISNVNGTQWTVSQRGLPTAEGGASTLTSHGGGSKIIITNNWQIFSDIATSLASKLDKAGGTMTGRLQFSGTNATLNAPSFATVAARDAALTSPQDGDFCTVAGDLYHYNGSTVQWEIADTGTPTPNATTSVTGKQRRATDAQFISETDDDGGEPLAPQPSQIKKNLTWTKDLTFGATINPYDPVYSDSSDGKWKHADANGSGTYDVNTLGIALDSGVDTDTGKRVAMPGSLITGMSGLTPGIVYLTDRPSISAATIAFVDSNPDTITDSGSGFVAAGFKAGDTIRVSGSGSNDGVYTINTVAAGTLTLIAGDSLVAEVAGASVTITSLYGTTAGTNQIILGFAPNSTTLYFNPRVLTDSQARNLLSFTTASEGGTGSITDEVNVATDPINNSGNVDIPIGTLDANDLLLIRVSISTRVNANGDAATERFSGGLYQFEGVIGGNKFFKEQGTFSNQASQISQDLYASTQPQSQRASVSVGSWSISNTANATDAKSDSTLTISTPTISGNNLRFSWTHTGKAGGTQHYSMAYANIAALVIKL